MTPNHTHFMELALEEAKQAEEKGNIPIGSVIVRYGKVIAHGHNEVTSIHDPTAHAETMALRKAGPSLGTTDLSDCTLYTSLEPCPMCCGAIMAARVSTLVLGGRYNPATTPYGRYTIEKLLELTQWGPRLTLVTDVLRDRCELPVEEWRRLHPAR